MDVWIMVLMAALLGGAIGFWVGCWVSGQAVRSELEDLRRMAEDASLLTLDEFEEKWKM